MTPSCTFSIWEAVAMASCVVRYSTAPRSSSSTVFKVPSVPTYSSKSVRSLVFSSVRLSICCCMVVIVEVLVSSCSPMLRTCSCAFSRSAVTEDGRIRKYMVATPSTRPMATYKKVCQPALFCSLTFKGWMIISLSLW